MKTEILLSVAVLAYSGCATLDNGDVGATSQEITNSNVVNQSLAFDNNGSDSAAYGAGCEVTDPNAPGTAKFMIAAGGIESGGTTYSDDAVLFRPGTSYDPDARTTFTDARAYAIMVPDPADSHACLMFGGEDGSSVKGQIVKLTAGWSPGTSKYTLTASNVGTLSTARSRLQAVVIASLDKVVLLGGFTSIGKANESAVIDVWDNTQSGTTAIPTLKNQNNNTVTLNQVRGDFGAGASGQASTRRIVVGGGMKHVAGVDTKLNSIEAFELDTSGKMTTTATNPSDVTALSPSQHTTIGTARDGLMLLYSSFSGNVETWVAGPGNGSADIQKFSIDWSSFTNASNSIPTDACALTNLVAVTSPLNIKMATDRLIIVGSSVSNQNTVQEYNAGTCTSVTTDSSSTALVNREGALGALVDTHVYYTAGATALNGTYHTTTFKVN